MIRLLRCPPLLALVLSCLALCLPLLLWSGDTPYTFDETNYYLPAIRQIRADWPRLDINRSSLSATAPGYPYLLAGLSFVTGSSLPALRLLNLGISLLLPLMLWFAWPPEASGQLRVCALVPLVNGCFFVRSASNLMTDNAALLAMAGALTVIFVPRFQKYFAWAGIYAALAVFFRQINIWLEAPLLIRLFSHGRTGPWWSLLPAPAVLLWLFLTWGGLVPLAWQANVVGIGYAAAPYQLAVLGVLGIFYYASSSPDWQATYGNRWTWAGAAVGLLVAVACPSAPSYDAGRWGGYFWTAAGHLPTIGQRSLLFLVLAPWGGWVLSALIRRLWFTAGAYLTLVWAAALLAFFASGLLNLQVHHRYYEPMILLLLIFWRVLLASAGPPAPAGRLGPLVFLGSGQVLITFLTAYGRTFGLL